MIRAWRIAGPALLVISLVMTGLTLVTGLILPGRQMVYDTRVNGNAEIFLLDVTHRLKFNLTHHEGEDSRPVWSPDGRYIAFESWRDGIRAIYVMEADGGNMHRLTTHTNASEYAPEWTADGEAILFRYYKHPESAIYRARPDGSNLQKVDAASGFQQQLVRNREFSNQFVDGAWGIYVTEGDSLRQLTDRNLVFREPPQWSDDDHLIAFLSQSETESPEIYMMDHEGNSLRQLTMDGTFKSNLRWRP